MKPKTIVPLVIGLGVGFFAIKMGLDMVQKAKGSQAGEAVVFVSAKQIEVASRITESMLSATSIPAAIVPGSAFTDKKALLNRVSAMTIAPGVPITENMLAPPGAEPGLRAIIPPGHRAVSVSVTEESAVAGFLTPGCNVDVSTVSDRDRTSKLILTDVEVGAVGQSMSEVGSDGKSTRITKSVTLFLEPHEVQMLNANTGGRTKVRLALRGNDRDPGESFWTKLMDNAGNMPMPKPKKLKPRPQMRPQHIVEVVHGAEMERLVFDDTGLVERNGSQQPRNRPAAPAADHNRSEPVPELEPEQPTQPEVTE